MFSLELIEVPLKTPSQVLLRQHSRLRLYAKLGGLLLFLFSALAMRQWIVEGVRLSDNALTPQYRNGSWVWVCKLRSCVDHASPGTPLLFTTSKGQRLLRAKAAGPGATLVGDTSGRVTAPGFHRQLRGDSWFFENSKIRIPKRNDSLVFSTLQGAEFDLAMRLFQQQRRSQGLKPIQLVASLWIDGHESSLDKAAITQIHNIPINTRDLPNYGWQEIRLIEMQILRNELGSSQVEIRRDIWNGTKQVKGFRVLEDCYFLLCFKGRDCADSREFGYVSRSQISGSIMKWLLKPAKS